MQLAAEACVFFFYSHKECVAENLPSLNLATEGTACSLLAFQAPYSGTCVCASSFTIASGLNFVAVYVSALGMMLSKKVISLGITNGVVFDCQEGVPWFCNLFCWSRRLPAAPLSGDSPRASLRGRADSVSESSPNGLLGELG